VRSVWPWLTHIHQNSTNRNCAVGTIFRPGIGVALSALGDVLVATVAADSVPNLLSRTLFLLRLQHTRSGVHVAFDNVGGLFDVRLLGVGLDGRGGLVGK